ncbi:beta-ketoacyl-ACP synthase 3 [Candidatus Sarmatiella mevalonica]|uniref:beta-ketoacyl-ACP synthase 3 n=1 Tax=Candidatus Sarmatiella mevalonica TaxID=2770581 RepID=UPI001920E044
MFSRIVAVGGFLPKRIVTNHTLSETLDTNDEWIMVRTGIKRRHIASESECTSDLALHSLQSAIEHARESFDPEFGLDSLDLILCATTTPDQNFPSLASVIHQKLGITKNIPMFDLQAVCSGFVYGLEVADAMIKSGKYRTIALVCAEKMSSLIDWSDRSTAILFGDGAGCAIIRADHYGLIDTMLGGDGQYHSLLYTDGGAGSNASCGKIRMEGKTLFKHAIAKMAETATLLLQNNNMSISDIKYVVPHQANIRIIEAIAQRLELPEDKIIITIQNHGNCSAASIPLALYEKRDLFNKGDIILFLTFGAGITWGGALLAW